MTVLPLFVTASLVCSAQTYDLLLRRARVIDPRNKLDGVRDVAIRDGKIAAVAENIGPAQAKQSIDLPGLILTPGLVDIHIHAFHTTGIAGAWAGDNSIAPDGFSFRTGVTTVADAGSAGWRQFETFRHTVIDRVKTRVYAFVNIAGFGMMGDINEQVAEDMQPDQVAKLAKKHADIVVGVKAAHYQKPDWTSVDRALEAGRLAQLPIMVDFGYFLRERPYYQLVTEHLRPGDISTHCYRSGVPFLDENGKLLDYLGQARKRGVKFDVGHGGGSFVFRNAAPAVAQGFYPDTISTDLHTGSMNAGMQDMPTTMSKFLNLGMPLGEIIMRSTWMPATIINRPQHGHLSVGADADIAVLRLGEGDFGFADSSGGTIRGRQRLLCEMTLLAGTVVWDWNARAGTDYRQMGPDYGLRPGLDFLVPPPKR